MANYYEILGLKDFSSAEDIEQAYQSLLKDYESKENLEQSDKEKLNDIKTAYQNLSNPEFKTQYDIKLLPDDKSEGLSPSYILKIVLVSILVICIRLERCHRYKRLNEMKHETTYHAPIYRTEEKPKPKPIVFSEVELEYDNWKEVNQKNGEMPKCYDYKRKQESTSNQITIQVGSGHDVAFKLIETNYKQCVRYIYLKRNSSYTMTKIPYGNYMAKVAYGDRWFTKDLGSQCVGKFLTTFAYEQTIKWINFEKKNKNNTSNDVGYNIHIDFNMIIDSEPQNNTIISHSDFSFEPKPRVIK